MNVPTSRWLLPGYSLIFMASLSMPASEAAASRCEQVPVVVSEAAVSRPSTQDIEYSESIARICQASARALAFLQIYGLQPQQDIHIEIVEHSLEHYGYVAFGSYDRSTQIISLMSLAAIMHLNTIPEMYGQKFDQVHYDGAVAHELAHAVFHQNSPNSRLSNAAQEYLAHVTQLAVLPADRRQSIIERAGVGAWESGDAISEVYMAMAPEKFAVKSYLHLTGSAEPEAFVTILLNNKWFYVYAP